jgi:hypothetical protein
MDDHPLNPLYWALHSRSEGNIDAALTALAMPFPEIQLMWSTRYPTTLMDYILSHIPVYLCEAFVNKWHPNVNVADEHKRTPLFRIRSSTHARILLAAGACVHQRDYRNETAVSFLARTHAYDVVFILLEHGASMPHALDGADTSYHPWEVAMRRRLSYLHKMQIRCRDACLAILGLRKRWRNLPKDVALMLARSVWQSRRNKHWD